MSWHILITTPALQAAGTEAIQHLQQAGIQLTDISNSIPLSPDRLPHLLEQADAVIAGLDPYSASVLDSGQLSRLKLIARWGVGFDNVDIPAATRNGILVTNTPGLLDEAVADYTFALLLAIARGLVPASISLSRGQWQPAWGHDVHGQTLGLVGFGRIARAVARRASGFNLRILAHDPIPNPDELPTPVTFVTLDQLLAESDFVSLHASLNESSRNLISTPQIARMKPTAFLINAGRGALLDETALALALHQGHLAGAAIDAFRSEPLPADHPLRSAPRLLLTPHQASFTRQTAARVSLATAQSILDVLHARCPRNLLNPAVLAQPNLRTPIHPPC